MEPIEVSSRTGRIESSVVEFKLNVGENWRVLAPRGEAFTATRAWRPVGRGATAPWFILVNDGGANTFGFGVKTQPRAMCSWRVDPGRGVSLLLDLRAGGSPLELGNRTLAACEVVRCESAPGETPWQTGRRLCAMMCPSPRLPRAPLFGFNDWYCAYGSQTARAFLADAAAVLECARGAAGTPYAVLDDGWQRFNPPEVERLTGKFDSGFGPWDVPAPGFGMEMPEFCAKVSALGAKPGIWYRPLCIEGRPCDPADPATVDRVRADMARFRDWGFKLVKADFLAYDVCGHYHSVDDNGKLVPDGPAWGNGRKTSAEALVELYRAMREAVGDDVVILGCNAENLLHLCAGLFEASRTGSDTSGRDWDQTRRNGVNSVAFGGLFHGELLAADPDCAGLVDQDSIPWDKNRQWIDLLSRSGMPLFVSWRRSLLTQEVRDTLTTAFRRAAAGGPPPEPLDWPDNPSPSRWQSAEGNPSYEW